jgi:organic radical activating enzyme
VKAAYTLNAEDTLEIVNRTARASFGREGEDLWIVLTGGEPSLQHDQRLADVLRGAGYRLAMESNGSRPIDRQLVDWLTISPKQVDFIQREGDDLKIVFTGSHAPGIAPDIAAVCQLACDTAFANYYLQPVDVPELGGPNYGETVEAVMRLGSPWRLSVQMHKVLGIP